MLGTLTLAAGSAVAGWLLQHAYQHMRSSFYEREDAAMLAPGAVARVRGMRVINLGGFSDALADPHEKQVMWARLKKIPPLGEPF